jgi:hypothetical protein
VKVRYKLSYMAMKKTTIFILVLVVLLGGGYWLLTQNTAEAPTTTPTGDTSTQTEPTPADTEEEPTEPTTPDADYVGLTEAEAAALAEENGVPFRVVERDGEMLMVTEDWRPGRINAVVVDGVAVSYTVEGADMDKGGGATNDAIIGMTIAEAEVYAEANGVPFRIGSVDGELRPVTLDYRPGRITASVVDGVVTSYSVE